MKMTKCDRHPTYKGIGTLRAKCRKCWHIYEEKHGQVKAIRVLFLLSNKYPNEEWY
jgi:hypothetical protein